MKCKECGSTNLNLQEIVTNEKKKKGIWYWVFVGWWLEPILWLFLTVPMIIIKIFKSKKYQSKVTKKAICQDCGHSWEL